MWKGVPIEKKYCSEKCRNIKRRIERGEGLGTGMRCKNNQGVVCEIQRCENCGWNPVVEKRRKEALYAQL
jgi:hypothetical protein